MSILSAFPDGKGIPETEKGAANGVASLDTTGKIPSEQLPDMNYIPTSQKGAASGVAELDANGLVPVTEGGTGANTASEAVKNLISAMTEKTELEATDIIGLLDVTGETGKKATLETLAALLGGGGAKIETGSYVGTGTYGSSNPCSLTFSGKLQYLHIYGYTRSDNVKSYPYFSPSKDYNTFNKASVYGAILTTDFQSDEITLFQNGVNSNGYSHIKISADRRTVTWYNDGYGAQNVPGSSQFNGMISTSTTTLPLTYHWFAIVS